jgi:hypothetical protein
MYSLICQGRLGWVGGKCSSVSVCLACTGAVQGFHCSVGAVQMGTVLTGGLDCLQLIGLLDINNIF